MTTPQALGQTIQSFADFLLKYFLVLAAAGALAMAIVELFKKVRDSRTRFYARATTHWMMDWGHGREAAFAELLHLSAGIAKDEATCRAHELIMRKGKLTGSFWLKNDQANTAFALESERMIVSFQDAADLSLTSPGLYAELFAFVTSAAIQDDREKWKIDAVQVPGNTPPTAEEMKARAERYARLRQAIKRKLDAFQMFTEIQWANRCQLWANIVGAAVLGAAFTVSAWNGTLDPAEWPQAIVFTIFGGMLAPVAKDVVANLQQVRQPRP